MSAFSDIVDTVPELHLARAARPSMRPVAPIERAEALNTFLSLANSAGLTLEETLSLDLVQKLEVSWPDEASRETLCSLGGDQAQKMVDVLQQVRLFIFFRLIRP
jgi:hypothetical protein